MYVDNYDVSNKDDDDVSYDDISYDDVGNNDDEYNDRTQKVISINQEKLICISSHIFAGF